VLLRFLLETPKSFRYPRFGGARSAVGGLDDLVAFADGRPQGRRLLLNLWKFSGNFGDVFEGLL
jgi:hypothetical protein